LDNNAMKGLLEKMVTPAARREAVVLAQNEHGLSRRQPKRPHE
jgi:hypothetical protein